MRSKRALVAVAGCCGRLLWLGWGSRGISRAPITAFIYKTEFQFYFEFNET